MVPVEPPKNDELPKTDPGDKPDDIPDGGETTPDGNVEYGDYGNDKPPIIDGGVLPEITVTGDNPDDVTVYGSYHCKSFTNIDGETYYRIYSTETGSYTYMSAEDYNKYLKGKSDTEAESIIGEHAKGTLDELGLKPASADNSHGTETPGNECGNGDGITTGGGKGNESDSGDGTTTGDDKDDGKVNSNPTDGSQGNVETEPTPHEWTDMEKSYIQKGLKEMYGVEYEFNITFNTDGTFTYKILDAKGNEVTPEEALAAKKAAETAAEDAKLKAALDWMYKNFYKADGTFNGLAFTNWVNEKYKSFGQQAFYYEGNEAVKAFERLKSITTEEEWFKFLNDLGNQDSSGSNSKGSSGGTNSGGNYGGSYGGSYGSIIGGGFNIFATGGGNSSGSASFDAFCDAMRQGWYEMVESMNKTSKKGDITHCNFMISNDDQLCI